MITEMTIPVYVDKYWMTEFDVWVEYHVTYGGSNVTYLSPAEAPEWVVNEIRGMPTELRGALWDTLPKLSGCLLGFAEDFLASPLGRECMIQAIEDEQYAENW